MVRLLLSRGANINAFDKRDRRAIHWAAYMGNISQRIFYCIIISLPLYLKTLKQIMRHCVLQHLKLKMSNILL